METTIKSLRHFKWDFPITAIALVVAYLYGGWQATSLAAILIVVEVVFSFDNAAVNAKYLERLDHFWRRMFLTVGILIAVFGMRLVFPFVIVCTTGGVSPLRAISLALERGDPHTPGTYGYLLHDAHISIAAFGGLFLLLLFLDFLLDPKRQITWLSIIEKPLIRLGRLNSLSVLFALAILLISGIYLPVTTPHKTMEAAQLEVFSAGLLGIVVYLLVSGISGFMQEREAAKESELDNTTAQGVLLAGRAAFSLFIFLEVLDASFSFDGVIGAFAITPDPIIIAIGLGVGAMYVRSLTIFLVEEGALARYRFLDHGAHWAIGALATMLILTIRWNIPDLVIGLVGIVFIAAAVFSSIIVNVRGRNRAQAAARPHSP